MPINLNICYECSKEPSETVSSSTHNNVWIGRDQNFYTAFFALMIMINTFLQQRYLFMINA